MSDATEEAIIRAKQAQQLLDDPLLADAFAEVERALVAGWRQSPQRDIEGREHLFKMLSALDAMKSALFAYVQDGQIAQHNFTLREGDRRAAPIPG